MDELRIVLLGKQGAGKSASGNTLLRIKSFHSAASSKRVTEACSMSMSSVNGRTIKVIDTPGWCDSPRFETDIKQEIIKCINMSQPGPHVFLLVLPIGRFTNEEINTVMSILKEFGVEVTKYMIVLFTKGDDLEDRSIEDYLEEVQSDLKTIIQLCTKRYHVFNNKDKDDSNQVSSLLKKIIEMVECNKEKYFTTAMYQKVELCLKKGEQSEENRIQQCRKEANNSVQDNSKSLSGKESCKMKEQQKSTQRTEHEGLKQRVGEEGERDLLDSEGKLRNLKVLHKKLEKTEGQLEQIKEELEKIKDVLELWQQHYEQLKQDKQKQRDSIKRLMQEKQEGKQRSMTI